MPLAGLAAKGLILNTLAIRIPIFRSWGKSTVPQYRTSISIGLFFLPEERNGADETIKTSYLFFCLVKYSGR